MSKKRIFFKRLKEYCYMSQEQFFNIDSIPDEFFQLACKAATTSLADSGITGIYNEVDMMKQQMKRIQLFEQQNGVHSQEFYCKKDRLK